jgi:hypothetical protein
MRSRLWLGVGAIVVAAVGIPVVIARHTAAAPTVKVAPLSVTDKRVLATSRPLVAALPAAIAEVPVAASDASGHRLSSAEVVRILDRNPALAPLARAIGKPTNLTAALVAGDSAVLSGDQPSSPDQLAPALEKLQAVEGDIVPAVRVVAATAGHSLSAARALSAVERDPHARDLAGLIAGWQQVYGAFILVEQAAAS